MNEIKARKEINRVTLIGFIANIFLSIGKLIIGIIAFSQALISDAINSFGDIISTIVSFIGLKISHKTDDKDHPFGHERFDNVAAIILSVIFFITALIIGGRAIASIIDNNQDTPVPATAAWITALAVVIVKETLFVITFTSAKKLKSSSLRAAALDHQMDVLSSAFALIGIVLARFFSLPMLDPIFSLLICLMIIFTSVNVFVESINKMIDKAAPEETVKQIQGAIEEVSGVCRIDELKTRVFGNRLYVDVEIACGDELSLVEAHNIAEKVHATVEQQFTEVKHIMVHVNPETTKKD
jgi:cation diffusion facilitator family transporter